MKIKNMTNIINIYVDLIRNTNGVKTIEDVPKEIRDDVAQALLDSSNNT